MTDTAFHGLAWQAKVEGEREGSLPLPAPVVASAPVLISDCVTPLGGETLLSLLWRRLDGDE